MSRICGTIETITEHVPPFDPDFGDVEMEVADRIGLELLAWLGAFNIGQAADVVALETAMQAGTGQMRDGSMERIETIVQRQERVPAESDDASSSFASTLERTSLGPMDVSWTIALLPLDHRLWVHTVALA